MKLVVHPLARDEIEAAIEKYAAISPSLGWRLSDEMDAIADELVAEPNRWAYYELLASDKRWRRRLTTGFPFVAIYEVIDQQVLLVALAHTARRPGYWQDRRL
ncbi:MAG: type II toxin-antitoxin system RelE/ParE family toxin [Planctomycetota bacterium]